MDQGDGSPSSRKAGRRIAAASQGVAGRRRRRVRRIRETVSQGGVADVAGRRRRRVRRIRETLDVAAGRRIRASLDVDTLSWTLQGGFAGQCSGAASQGKAAQGRASQGKGKPQISPLGWL